MTSSKDPGFMEALTRSLEKGEPTESPFRGPPAEGVVPAEDYFSPADVIMHPSIARKIQEDRQRYLKRITNGGAGPAMSKEFKYDVFTVHRNASDCAICGVLRKSALKKRHIAMEEGKTPEEILEINPEIDNLVCPHTRRDEYIALMNRGMRNEITIGSHREETLRDGSVQVCMSWGERDTAPQPKQQKNTNTREDDL